MKGSLLIAVVGLSGLLAGCVASPKHKYDWGNYDRALYSFYKDPATVAEYAAELKETIEEAERTQRRVAPGMHAEYGFLLMQQGKSKEAMSQFESEKAMWPESTYLMNSMIQTASSQVKKADQSKE